MDTGQSNSSKARTSRSDLDKPEGDFLAHPAWNHVHWKGAEDCQQSEVSAATSLLIGDHLNHFPMSRPLQT